MLHPDIRFFVFEDKSLAESSIETTVCFMREPDEIRGSIVGAVSVKVVALMVAATGAYPRKSDEEMAVWITDEAAHPWVVGMDVGFAAEFLRYVGFVLVQTSG